MPIQFIALSLSAFLVPQPGLRPLAPANLPRNARFPLISRAPPIVACEGGLESLSTDELKGLLRHRGVDADDLVDKSDMISRLEVSTPPRTSSGEPLNFSPAEASRVGVFERVSPAVAFISTSLVAPSLPMSRSPPGEIQVGTGSGFVWDTEGHIITNYHVVAGAPSSGGAMSSKARSLPKRVKVSLQGSAETVEATVVGFEADKDLAVLKIDPDALPLTPLDVATSSELRVGQSVLAIGNPFGLDYTLTQGIVSALGRDVNGYGGRPIKDCIQTDASINPGNSGGPLLDSSGRLIGVNTMIYSQTGGNVGIGFAIPSDTVRRVVNQIIKYGPNSRPSLGASLVDDKTRRQLAQNLRRELNGALLTEVVPGSPADALKLAPCERRYGGVLLGDMITAVNGRPIKTNEDLLCALEETEPERPITLTVSRGCDPKNTEELHITPVARKALMAGR